METKLLEIKEKQKLGDILKFIPNKAIFNKVIPGLGATYLELICDRNSLLIEPNKPVIKDKVRQFKEKGIDVLGVYHGISDGRIIKYIKSDNPFKKIITTPESYLLRIKPLMAYYKIDMFAEYFMLYDESERTIQDIGYRSTITAPLDDFFVFAKRAMVTATPIMPSDPRFEQNGFFHLVVKPEYQYAKKIAVHTTNNVLISIKRFIQENPSDHFCFFLNSTDGIHSLISYLKIEAKSSIFCGEDSVRKLKEKGFPTAFQDLKPLTKYNFFTSSFFSAVDIELEYKPDVVILTDLFFAEHSIIDPSTEAVQIVGRFRQGFNSLTHITNINPEIRFQTREEILSYLKGCQDSYNHIKLLHDAATVPGQRDSYKQAMEGMTFSKYVRSDGKIDWFLIDNKLDEDMVKSYYNNTDSLLQAYSKVLHFKVTHTSSNYPLSDKHRLKRTMRKDNPELFRAILEQLDILKEKNQTYTIDNSVEEYNNLNQQYPEICEIHRKLSADKLKETEFKLSKAKKVLKQIKKKENDKQYPFPAIQEILATFDHRLERDISTTELNEVASRVKKKFGLTQTPAQILNTIYRVTKRKQTRIKGEQVWTRKLTDPKFLLDL